MGDIRDELLKAGLISSGASQEIARTRGAERRRGRSLSAEADVPSSHGPATEGQPAVSHPEELVRQGMVTPVPGSRRFHFVDRSGQVPFLEVGEDTQRKLANGALAIVESCGASPEEFVVVTEDAARALSQTAPEAIRFWNR